MATVMTSRSSGQPPLPARNPQQNRLHRSQTEHASKKNTTRLHPTQQARSSSHESRHAERTTVNDHAPDEPPPLPTRDVEHQPRQRRNTEQQKSSTKQPTPPSIATLPRRSHGPVAEDTPPDLPPGRKGHRLHNDHAHPAPDYPSHRSPEPLHDQPPELPPGRPPKKIGHAHTHPVPVSLPPKYLSSDTNEEDFDTRFIFHGPSDFPEPEIIKCHKKTYGSESKQQRKNRRKKELGSL